ncbi:uncharacterized protein MELLADRAFT_69855 [Melampsora larici-populina 98AG31]|uniref:Secreted protein n=1 Tax=Melampsora larici-populina (strain 98AG31 / pathotype 3-4-7) TaxID=747676 RepID=F4SCH5_MELLP|nr:uncharacterized protein MELLADRAFT_69855 [Melampsora larici-populina 98AG31]EGF97657.1 hypothetical protein MELLADRAFT_69855 [Melampsora larici-populina 98AG31]
MPSSFSQKLAFFILFYLPAICGSISKRELRAPGTVVGKVGSYLGARTGYSYPVGNTIHHVPLRDLRSMEVPDLETYGFTYVSNKPVEGLENFAEFSHEHKATLEADSAKLVQELGSLILTLRTRANRAFAFGGGYRDHTSPGSTRPVSRIHSDMSLEGAQWWKTLAHTLLSGSRDPKKVDFAKSILDGENVVIYNVWRPLDTVRDNHLGFCSWDSLLEEDALQSYPNPSNAGDALQPWRYREGQQWFFLSKQKSHEAFIFKQHDDGARDKHGVNVPHASFNLEGDQGPPTRKSFEVKVIAIIDPPPITKSPSRLRKHIKSFSTQFNRMTSRNIDERNPR